MGPNAAAVNRCCNIAGWAGATYAMSASPNKSREDCMADKKQKTTPTPELTDEEQAKVVGGMLNQPPVGGLGGGKMGAPESCTASTDTGMMGCPG